VKELTGNYLKDSQVEVHGLSDTDNSDIKSIIKDIITPIQNKKDFEGTKKDKDQNQNNNLSETLHL